jgi:hypothetical protein
MTKLLPSFLEAVFTGGRIYGSCGFCNRIHICLDDPVVPAPELPIVGDSDRSLTSDDIASAIRGYEEQAQYGMNSCYDQRTLIGFLNRIPPSKKEGRFPNDLNERVQIVFRCDDDRANGMIERFGPFEPWVEPDPEDPKPKFTVKPLFGSVNIGIGWIDGKPVVEGCCEDVLLRYQNFAWNDRKMIGRFLVNETALLLDIAEEDHQNAKKIEG